ncbi:restriction endonuclease subunit S [Flavobacterium sp. MMLR14_040]|uniref:restriction endonuclease subunit S n=1 Tax=Flavobacterium sp. MMLR14_040 TaxID=3093843 RepID=UPI00298FDB32|nr:restriction endonuclease subunit S [Flavobacterium sp. MMLR14_040]MDW8852895.1 restriction endonuclease subunit S [Flavobacterium sp. MMLR14_040]
MEKQLPKNWTIVQLEKLGEEKYYAIGDGDHGQIKPSDYKDSGIPYIRVSDLDWGFFKEEKLVYISEEVHNKNLKSELLPGDILIAKTGATIGKCCIVPSHIKKANTTSSVGKVSINKNLTSSKWILYYFLSPDFFKLMWSHSHRTAQPGFNIIDIKNFPVPLPPLSEQNRIVAKLDSLFSQLELIKTSMKAIPILLKNFRHQVLDKEFNQNFKKSELKDLCLKIQDGAHHSPKITYESQLENTFPYITSKNIRNNYMKLDNVRYVDFEFHNSIYPRCTPELGDVLLTKDGANTGNITLNELNEPFSLLSSVCLIKTYKEKLLPEYLKYYFQSNVGFSELIGEMTGTAIKRIVLKKIKATQIPVPSLEKQREIVNRAESLFAKADAIEQKYKSLKQKIDTLPQALLHKAFKGELTERLDSDGNATELLNEIKKLKLEVKKKSK